MESTLQFNVR